MYRSKIGLQLVMRNHVMIRPILSDNAGTTLVTNANDFIFYVQN